MELKNLYAQDVNGNIIPLATCMLYLPNSETLAVGLQDVNGATLSNPFSADSEGLVSFAAPDGLYDLVVMSTARKGTLRLKFIDIDAVSAVAESAAWRTAGLITPAAVAPISRDDGLSLQGGDRYFNTQEQIEYIYQSGEWKAICSLQLTSPIDGGFF